MRVGYFFMFIAFVRQIVRQKNKRIIKTRYSSEFYKYIKGRLMGLEPMSAGATIQCVNQLHHSRHVLKYIIISKSNRQHIFLVILKIEVLYIHGTN